MEKMEEEEVKWRKEIVPEVFQIVIRTNNRLTQKDVISVLLVSPWLYRTLSSNPSLWHVLDLHEMTNAGDRLIAALSIPRYQHVKQIILEFAQEIEDKHLILLKTKSWEWLRGLELLNLNVCQKISDKGIEAITSASPNLNILSIYWNVSVNNITDTGLNAVADNYPELEVLNLTSFTDEAYKKIASLSHLKFLDLCGAQNLSDHGLSCIAECNNLVHLNLTWCVRVTDVGVIAVAEGCTSLEFLSLFGIVGVTDKCLEALSRFCSNTLMTLDVNGCIGIKRRSRDELLQLFPHLICFKVHS
ncbi:hypothetical protein IFM89_016602 [Coptis chinensis]|uniref:F-box/LRR-repeat protein 15-like leucin rich repeat domain-containing protein n=1 Tax=Coptis chinensis TaxID=261450 RepID=A0A835IQL6_9MAGN|nr:hypothetical protein IFM89_016602 [Coptis chinensis]